MNRSVLFLCTGNSCRSQMAEGWLRHLAGSHFAVASAGTQPVGLNPHAVRVMKDIGVDISHHLSKRIDGLSGVHFDYVITVCDRAKESCPTLPGAKLLMHWSFADPAEAKGTEEDRLNMFRQVRDAIGARIKEFLHHVAPE